MKTSFFISTFTCLLICTFSFSQVNQANKLLTISGKIVSSQNIFNPFKNANIALLAESGQIISTATTDSKGFFKFDSLDSHKKYMIQLAESNPETGNKNKYALIDTKAGIVRETGIDGIGGKLVFRNLPVNPYALPQVVPEENSSLRTDFKGKLLGSDKSPIANSIVNLMNDKGQIVRSTKTNPSGDFMFASLPADQIILFALNEHDPQLKKFKKIFLTDAKGTIVKEIKRSEHGFKFSVLPSDKKKLEIVYADDPWLKVLQLKTKPAEEKSAITETTITIIENIYFTIGESKVSSEMSKTLDKLVAVMKKDSQLVVEITSHTDSRSSMEYNMKLSVKRANAAVAYIIKNGIAPKRVIGKGYGESKLINQCADGFKCSEDEHARNRRTEFKISLEGK